jgi:hypothetical protein
VPTRHGTVLASDAGAKIMVRIFVLFWIGCIVSSAQTNETQARSLLRKMQFALINGDQRGFKSCFVGHDHEKILEKSFDFTRAMIEFQTLLAQKFGDDALEQFEAQKLPNGKVAVTFRTIPVDPTWPKEASLTEDKGSVLFLNPATGTTNRMERIGKEYKIVTDSIAPADRSSRRNIAALLSRGISAVKDTTAEMKSRNMSLIEVKEFLSDRFAIWSAK